MPIRAELEHEVRRDAQTALVVLRHPRRVRTFLSEVVRIVWAVVHLLKVRIGFQARGSGFELLLRVFRRVGASVVERVVRIEKRRSDVGRGDCRRIGETIGVTSADSRC